MEISDNPEIQDEQDVSWGVFINQLAQLAAVNPPKMLTQIGTHEAVFKQFM